MIDNIIANFIMWWLKRKLTEYRQVHRNSHVTIYQIEGTGKHYPNYLMFTDIKRVKHEMMDI